MTKWLHRNGFSYRKPVGVPHKCSAEAQQAFVETYEKLKQEADDDEPILFIDGVHPTQGIKLAYGWMPAGKKAHVVETTSSRTRLNIMGALNLNDIGSTVIREYDTIDSLNICRFFIAIVVRETYPITQKVHIILDGAGYQLRKMRPGQRVDMSVDAFPGHVFQGRVESIQRATGSVFSILPAENATGNYVKVVQRVPVRIVFTDKDISRYPLSPGMSVVPRV